MRSLSKLCLSESFAWVLAPLAGLATLVGVCGVASNASGQCIPAETVERVSLNEQDEAAIASCVEQHSRNLDNPLPELMRSDKAALLAPLANPSVSASFRLRYSRALLPRVSELSKSSTEMVAINALVIAGDLATDGAADVVIAALNRENVSVRYQAVFAATRTFEAMTGQAVAIALPKAQTLLNSVQARFAQETDPLVLDALVRACLQAAAIKDLREPALLAACKGGSLLVANAAAKNQTLSDGTLEVCLRATSGVREVISLPNVTIARETALAAAALCGDVLSNVSRAVASKKVPLRTDEKPTTGRVDSREIHAQAALSAETLLLLVGNKIQGSGFQGKGRTAGASLRANTVDGDAQFLISVGSFIGDQGLLTQAPFEFAADRFKSR